MTLDTIIMLTGVIIAVVPFLGLPSFLSQILLVLAGAFVVALGIVVRRKGERLYRAPLRAKEEIKAQTGDE